MRRSLALRLVVPLVTVLVASVGAFGARGASTGAGGATISLAPSGTTSRESIATDGTQANAQSLFVALSADASVVAFASDATTLVPGDTNGVRDVFVRDRTAGTTTRVSVPSAGAQANGMSGRGVGCQSVAISADGRFVAFDSAASNLVPGDTNARWDIFVHDRQTGVTERASIAAPGLWPEGTLDSFCPAISADGRYVAFASNAPGLVIGDWNAATDIFVRDRVAGTTVRASVASDGGEAAGGSNRPAISADGRFVAFDSLAANLAPSDTNANWDVFVHDMVTGATARLSVSAAGTEGNGMSQWPAISADGRIVAFTSHASNLVPGDTNNADDVFVRDLLDGTITLASSAGSPANGFSANSTQSLSADGRYLTFVSDAPNLVGSDTNNRGDVFVRDRISGTITLASMASDGSQANGTSTCSSTAISGDGSAVVFDSLATNLVPLDTNAACDVFLRGPAATLVGTTTTVGSSVSTSLFGERVTFTAWVSAASGTPTGSAIFKDGAAVLGTAPLSGGSASLATTSLAVGTHWITAEYGGSATYAPSVSFALAQTVIPSDTLTGIASSLNPATAGAVVELSATVTPVPPGAGTPTGSVTFFDGATALGTGTAVGGVATLATATLAAGTHSITAAYGGDASFNASTSAVLSQVVLGTVVQIDVTEAVAVSDAATVLPPAVILIDEPVSVSDSTSIVPPAIIVIGEAVVVGDGAQVVPPVIVSIGETVGVGDAPSVANTPSGSGVVVPLADPSTGSTLATVTFTAVTASGDTTLTTSNDGPSAPAGFRLGNPPVYVELATTASFVAPVRVCMSYAGIAFRGPPRLFHFEGTPGAWVDRTVSVDRSLRVVCGDVTTFSPFVLAEDALPPTTSVALAPAPNAGGWHNGPVALTFTAVDDPGGVVHEIDLALSGAESGTSVVPGATATITVSAEGTTTITYFAVDENGNSETARTVVVRIDRTAPEALLRFDPAGRDLVVIGRDTGSGPSGPIAPSSVVTGHERDEDDDDGATELRGYHVTDVAGNTLDLVVTVRRHGHELKATLTTLRYNGGTAFAPLRNRIAVEYATARDGTIRELEQQVEAGRGDDGRRVEAKYSAKDDVTIITVEGERGERRSKRGGLVLIGLSTLNGALAIEY